MTLKDAQNGFIISEATKMFLESSIDKVTISAIAKRVGVGEATLYRRFSTKQTLVMECALYLGKEVYGRFQVPSEEGTGYERLHRFYDSYLEIFIKDPSYYAFLFQLDNMLPEAPADEMHAYESGIDAFWDLYNAAYGAGLEDGTIRNVGDERLFYYSTTHALQNLCKKLTCQGNLIAQDASLDKAGEVRCLIDIIMYSLHA
ncbi:MAG: TetR/AcrR family transcriptional regulator; helix-turn-helix transcriptional regulator [Clostridia bacterium]|nr:TetR/AcrR family transcriptional regulator; helix-turn-helix transcriptional regulator [Clostridia bacterium]